MTRYSLEDRGKLSSTAPLIRTSSSSHSDLDFPCCSTWLQAGSRKLNVTCINPGTSITHSISHSPVTVSIIWMTGNCSSDILDWFFPLMHLQSTRPSHYTLVLMAFFFFLIVLRSGRDSGWQISMNWVVGFWGEKRITFPVVAGNKLIFQL